MTVEGWRAARRDAIFAAMVAAESAVDALRAHLAQMNLTAGVSHRAEELARTAEAFTSLAVSVADRAPAACRERALRDGNRADAAANRVRYLERTVES